MRQPKQVHDNDTVAKLWANKSQASARNGKDNLFFTADNPAIIWSYGSHFPLAIHVTNAEGTHAVLMNEHNYSPTTQRHCSSVRRALNYGDTMQIFDVPLYSGGRFDHEASCAYFEVNINEAMTKAVKARVHGVFHYERALATVETARAYVAFFGLSVKFSMPATSTDKAKSLLVAYTARRLSQ